MRNIYNLTHEELENYFTSKGEKKFRATQIFEWLYRNRVDSFDQMTNVAKKTIEELKADFYFGSLEIALKQVSLDGTTKYLFRLNDGKLIETVLMRHNYGNSICVTTEVGCNMGCSFCASGELGKVRNLELAELVEQVLMVQKDLDKVYERISNIVVMGIGEPFDNYDNVLKFLKVVNFPKGLEIGARHITVSTCGIVPKIKEFASFELQVNLAISLHAPNNNLRSKIMKINKVYPIEEIMDAVKYYLEKTNRRVTFEYILLKDVNDSTQCAKELAHLIKGMNAYVNLIPYNEVTTKSYRKVTRETAEQFFKILDDNHIQATLRMEHGADIDAACGQLRAKKMKEQQNE
ncbi:MAG: 23S rRNA (adenine(2503)-C(2))-methyltransferase RlmN [Bacilli bacterium]